MARIQALAALLAALAFGAAVAIACDAFGWPDIVQYGTFAVVILAVMAIYGPPKLHGDMSDRAETRDAAPSHHAAAGAKPVLNAADADEIRQDLRIAFIGGIACALFVGPALVDLLQRLL